MATETGSAVPSSTNASPKASEHSLAVSDKAIVNYSTPYKGATLRSIVIQEVNKEALHLYNTNLRRETGQIVLACDPKMLAAAQERAINVELWMKENRPKLTTSKSNFASTPSQRNVCFQNPTPVLIEAPQPRLSLLAPIPRQLT